MNARIERPIRLAGCLPLGTDSYRSIEFERREHRIEYVTPHIAEGSGAKVGPFAPVHRVIIAVADKWPLGADPEPQVPIEAVRDGIVVRGKRRGVAPRLWNLGMCFLDLANDAVPDQPHRQPIMVHRLDLNAHLRDQFPALGELG